MTGSEVKYRQVWIDKDGNMGSMVITGPSEEQQKADEDRKIEKKKENDLVLKIGFDSSGLYDIGQEKGYGAAQNMWMKRCV